MLSKPKLTEPANLVRSKIARNILLGLTAGLLVPVVLTSPYGLYFMLRGAVRAYFRKKDFYREIKRLERKGYVALTKTPEGFLVRLLKKGKKRRDVYQLQEVKLSVGKSWDKKWRLLIFDIPEESKVARDLLSRRLKELGMYNIQRSVFIYPYDCRKELEFITEYYHLSKYTFYGEISYFEIERELLRFFKL